MSFVINPELKTLLPPLSPEAREQLRADIVAAGRARNPLIVWVDPGGARTLLEGHNRYEICSELGLPFDTVDEFLPDLIAAKARMLEHQLGRRNLTDDQTLAVTFQSKSAKGCPTPLRLSGIRLLHEMAPDLFDRVLSGKQRLQGAVNDCHHRLQKESGSSQTSPKPVATKAPKGRIHVVIGDTQVKEDVPTEHLTWIGRYIAEQFVGQNIAIIHLGDHWDMPSLSSYDQGKKEIEGKRYLVDVKAGNDAFATLNAPIEEACKRTRWTLERHFLFGNHEERIVRACNDHAYLDGQLSLNNLDTCGWQRHKFLEPVDIDGISYCHYFYHPNTSKPYAGENLETRLKTIGRSFTMGHQQGRKWGERQVGHRRHLGLVLGSSYVHDEGYHGPQGNAYWRGIVVCHQVENGQYDPMFVSLDYLCRRYEKMTLEDFLRHKKVA